jgi:hypothetical protein
MLIMPIQINDLDAFFFASAISAFTVGLAL